jgi:hypothetical protein
MLTPSHDPVQSVVKSSRDQFGCIVLRYLPHPELGSNASRINLGVSIFRWRLSIPRAITLVRNNYLDLVVGFGGKEDRDEVKQCLDMFASDLSHCLRPEVAIESVRQICAENYYIIQVSEIVSVRASTLAVAARDFALTFLGQQNEFCTFAQVFADRNLEVRRQESPQCPKG